MTDERGGMSTEERATGPLDGRATDPVGSGSPLVRRASDPVDSDSPLDGLAAAAERARSHLSRLAETSRLRSLRPTRFGPTTPTTELIDLTHNDYLGLRSDADFQARAHAAARLLPAGAGASRLLGGEHEIFETLETAFAAFKRAPSALYFPSGYAANEAVVPALAKLFAPGELRVHSDALNHASIIDGIRLSGLAPQDRVVYRHADLDDLESKLATSAARVNLIVTESLFSMDGDVVDLPRLAALARAHRGLLVLDEAHAVFCLGPHGRGLAESSGLAPDQLVTINTCGKAMAAQGALVAGPVWLRDLLINTARTFIYTTAPSPWSAAALLTALSMSNRLDDRRARLANVAEHVRSAFARFGLDTGPSTSHVIPVIIGRDADALQASELLARQGVLVKAVRPPTVPEGTSRLRLSLHAALEDAQVDALIAAFERVSLRKSRTDV